MKLNKILAGLVAVAASSSSMAGLILAEGFDVVGNGNPSDISLLIAKGWAQQNLSSPIGTSGWFQGNPNVFSASSGAANSYLGANFLNGQENAGGTISNWLMTPVVAINKTVSMTFDLRLLGEGFLDTVEVYYSASGASTTISDFSLLNTYASTSDTGWIARTASLASFANLNTTGRFAFRYVAANTNTQADYIGIDSVNVVPEPASLALVGLGLAGALASRRRKIAA